jgi:PAS domain S-box-containing protein
MQVAAMPRNESERIDALTEYDILDTLPEEDYNAFTRLAAQICGVPLAVISFVDKERQWFKSKIGIDFNETLRDISFCSHAILQEDVFIVNDARNDVRFADNPLVTDGLRVRFYAGASLVSPSGAAVGTLCVLDQKPHELTSEQTDALRSLSRMLVAKLELRKTVLSLTDALVERHWADAERNETQELAHLMYEQTERSEQLLRSVVDATADWIFVKDQKFEYVFANKSFAEDHGTTVTEIIGKNDCHLGFTEEIAVGKVEKGLVGFRDDDEAVLRGGMAPDRLGRVRVDGIDRILEVKKVPVRGTNGDITAVLGYCRDVTASYASAEALRVSEARFQRISANLPGMLFQFVLHQDATYDVPFVTSGCRDLWHCEPEDIRTNPKIFSDSIHIKDRKTFEDSVANTIEGLVTWEWKGRIVSLAGDEHWIHLKSRPEALPNGDILCDGLVMDITQQKTLESKLSHAQKMESIGQLAAGVAHEVNTPTQYIGDNVRFLSEAFTDLSQLIKVYNEIVRDNGDLADAFALADRDADLQYLLQDIPRSLEQTREGVERISKIIGAMKEFSHPGTQEKTLADFNRGIESTLTVARNEWKYLADIETDFDPDIPPVLCLPSELNQVWLNIIVNAAHAISDAVGPNAIEHGKIVVVTKLQGEYVEARFSDTGTGMPDEVKARIFDPFFTTKEVGRGTGQGLAIAHSVVIDKHDGTVEVQSEPGKGTTFIVRVPIGKAA